MLVPNLGHCYFLVHFGLNFHLYANKTLIYGTNKDITQ